MHYAKADKYLVRVMKTEYTEVSCVHKKQI